MSARRNSDYAARNSAPITLVLSRYLPLKARVLEIASGTGQHAVAAVRRCADVTWHPSDIDPQALASIADWRSDEPKRIAAPLRLDVTAREWWRYAPQEITSVYSANMIHIAPRAALPGLAEGTSRLLPQGGIFALYGPFLFGADSAPSNQAFSERLQARNPEWGVYEIDHVKQIFAIKGLSLRAQIAMPANNHMLIFQKTG